MTECRHLLFTLVSSQNIGAGRGEGQVKVYAEVSLNGDPIWNHSFPFTIQDLSIRERGVDVVVKLYHQRTRGDLLVAELKIPIPHLFAYGIRASLSFPASPTGRIKIAYQFREKFSVRNRENAFRWLTDLLNPDPERTAIAILELQTRLFSYLLTRLFSYLLGIQRQPNQVRRGGNLQYDNDSEESSSKTDEQQGEERRDGKALMLRSYHIQLNSSDTNSTPFIFPLFQQRPNRMAVTPTISKYLADSPESSLEEKSVDEGSSKFHLGVIKWKHLISFCSLFPLDYEFTKDVLVWQWIGGGLNELDKKKEKLLMNVFDALVDWDCIIPTDYDYVFDQTKYKIGDKMSTILQKQLSEPKFAKYSDSKQSHQEPTKVEYLYLTLKEIDRAKLKQYSHLRALIIHGCNEVDHLPPDLFKELKTLKVLNLSRTNIVELPSSVENLKGLRFLDVSETPIVWLPEIIGRFTHLQTLILAGCLQLECLPECTSNLINLRHLILDVVRQLESMPASIGKLSNLRTLSAFLVGEQENGCSVRELKYMNKLTGSFRLLNLENIKTKEEATEAYLYMKVGLRKIELQWSNLQDEKTPHEEEILDSLQPHFAIQELKILFYSGGVLPSWICNPSFKELVSVFFYKCRYCISLPSLGELPSLKFLNIIENNEAAEIDSSFCRKQRNAQHQPAFPKLEKLRFESMSKLEQWTGLEEGDFPSLCHLVIEYCPKFVGLPLLSRLKSLLHLEIRYCPELSFLPEDKLPSSLESLMIKESPKLKEQCSDKDWSKIAGVPTVYFDHQKFHPQM